MSTVAGLLLAYALGPLGAGDRCRYFYGALPIDIGDWHQGIGQLLYIFQEGAGVILIGVEHIPVHLFTLNLKYEVSKELDANQHKL